MMLWEYDLRRDCYQALIRACINYQLKGRDLSEIGRVFDVKFDLGKIGEIRRRVATKSKINMR